MKKSLLIIGLSEAEHLLDESLPEITLLYAGPRFQNDLTHFKTTKHPLVADIVDRYTSLGFDVKGVILYADIYSLAQFMPDMTDLKLPIICLVGDTHHGDGAITRLATWLYHWGITCVALKQTINHNELFRSLGFEVLCLPQYGHNVSFLEPHTNYIERVVFVGSLSPLHKKRRVYLQRLLDIGLPIDIIQLPRANSFKAYNAYACSFNMPLNGDLNYRIWEIMSAGGVCLTEEIPGTTQDLSYAKNYSTIVTYNSVDDCYQKAYRIINDRSLRNRIAKEAQQVMYKAKTTSENLQLILTSIEHIEKSRPLLSKQAFLGAIAEIRRYEELQTQYLRYDQSYPSVY